jgi:hypothetical protein
LDNFRVNTLFQQYCSMGMTNIVKSGTFESKRLSYYFKDSCEIIGTERFSIWMRKHQIGGLQGLSQQLSSMLLFYLVFPEQDRQQR